ncbi:MAG: hypothetical protein ACREPI_10485, partial [Candidatus Dormibacterales bacterium]
MSASGPALGRPAPPPPSVRVTRAGRSTPWVALGSVVTLGVLALLPLLVFSNVTDLLVNFFILLVVASMWNLLAGYAGLISV